MDVHAWLEATEYRRPPDSTPPVTQPYHQRDATRYESHNRQQIAHKSGFQRSRSPISYIYPLTARSPRLNEHSEVPPRDVSIRSLRNSDTIGESAPGGIDDNHYRRKPRRKTRPDRYEPKTRLRADQPKQRGSKSRKRRKVDTHNRPDQDTERVRNSLALNGRLAKRRLTLPIEDNFGIFRNGKASARPVGQKGIPDLMFNDLSFLEEHAIAGRRRSEVQQGHQLPVDDIISTYFQPRRFGKPSTVNEVVIQPRQEVAYVDSEIHPLQPQNRLDSVSAIADKHAVDQSLGSSRQQGRTKVHSYNLEAEAVDNEGRLSSSAPIDDQQTDDYLIDLVIGSKRSRLSSSSAKVYRTTDVLDIMSDALHKEALDAACPSDDTQRSHHKPHDPLLLESALSSPDLARANHLVRQCGIDGPSLKAAANPRLHNATSTSKQSTLPVRGLQRFHNQRIDDVICTSKEPQISISNTQLWRQSPFEPGITPGRGWVMLRDGETSATKSYEESWCDTTSVFANDSLGIGSLDSRTEFSIDGLWQRVHQHATSRTGQALDADQSAVDAQYCRVDSARISTDMTTSRGFWKPNRLY